MPSNNKRILKNTGLLYIRMAITMIVTLYISRIILNTLGVVDYGIYNVVGGVVTMFGFLNATMASATQRFISYELGLSNFSQLNKVFNTSVLVHGIIALLIVLLGETLGLWFLNTQMQIPDNRIVVANWVYQFSILTFIISVLQVPYNAAIIANEKMTVYAYVSIIEALLKLAIAFAIVYIKYDKLKLYSILVFLVTFIIAMIYRSYCILKYKELKFRFIWDKPLFIKITNYAGWGLFGNLAVVSINQGTNILLNIFFGTIINAARAIAFQISGAINSFVNNFQLAMNPQIVKSFAVGDKNSMHNLIYTGSKFSFFLLLFLSLPVLLETKTILTIWLINVPDYTVLFCRLVIINALIDSLSGPLMTGAQATGDIKKYQVLVGTTLLLTIPISFFFLKLGYPPQVTMYINIVFSLFVLLIRIVLLKSMISISMLKYFKYVIIPCIIVSISSFIFPYIIHITIMNPTIRLIINCITCFASVLICTYLWGLALNEKNKIINVIKSRIK